ncbi:MAG: flagellar FliJ family protein [Alphaproteobacteria bacterium]
MKSLATLIKLQKTYVDEQRLHLARLLEQLDQIQNKIVELEIRKAREQAVAKDNETRTTYGAFLKDMVMQGRALEKERHTAALAVKIAQEKLAELFEEQKRYEIAEEQRIEEEAQAARRRETLALDEVGGVMHERKKRD